MDNKAILDEVATRVTVLEQHISRLKNKPEKLHGIDVEVMGEKVKEIYTLIHTLKTGEIEIEVKAPEVKDVDKVPMVEVKPEPEIPEPKAPEMSMEEEQGARSEEQKPKIEVEEKEISNEQQSTSNEQLPAPQPAITEPQAPDPEPAKTTADLFSGPKTIADSFQAEEDNSIAATVNPQPTQDLKLAIGINDKFLFINELFQGDLQFITRQLKI